jgi:hypothetical protein
MLCARCGQIHRIKMTEFENQTLNVKCIDASVDVAAVTLLKLGVKMERTVRQLLADGRSVLSLSVKKSTLDLVLQWCTSQKLEIPEQHIASRFLAVGNVIDFAREFFAHELTISALEQLQAEFVNNLSSCLIPSCLRAALHCKRKDLQNVLLRSSASQLAPVLKTDSDECARDSKLKTPYALVTMCRMLLLPDLEPSVSLIVGIDQWARSPRADAALLLVWRQLSLQHQTLDQSHVKWCILRAMVSQLMLRDCTHS